ncbi:MAG: HD domain-containing protein [Lachnospiraceae bacterium]|nr:HD domain-containing protein [Lachnospiraceae bacterium]
MTKEKNLKGGGLYKKLIKHSFIRMMVFCLFGIFVNLFGYSISKYFNFPIGLDNIGTIFCAAVGGYLPGIFVGFATNMLEGIFVSNAIYYALFNILIAIVTTFFVQKGLSKKLPFFLLYIVALTVFGGVHGTAISWFIEDHYEDVISNPLAKSIYDMGEVSEYVSSLISLVLFDIFNNIIAVIIVFVGIKLIPGKIKRYLKFDGWQQTELSDIEKREMLKSDSKALSLRTKILVLLIFASFSIAIAAAAISYILYRNSNIETNTNLAKGTADIVRDAFIAHGLSDRVDELEKEGDKAQGYKEFEDILYDVKESSPNVEYVYIYKIEKDGCHVIFDLDTEDFEGSDPGTVVEFDPSFEKYLPDLFAGKEIEPIISNDSYGWLLTVYNPVYDTDGNIACYACVDISMNLLTANSFSYFAKLISLFLSFFIVILAIGLWVAEYNIILPVNTIAKRAGAFAYDTEEERDKSLKSIKDIKIKTGDEIENLYDAVVKTTMDSMHYVTDLQHKNETISQMQNGIILVLADIVEGRDEDTGDHVRKTASYTKIIMDGLKKHGYYLDQLTDEFMYNVVNSAPLHDIGKINISDTILNKPGRLTDEEFEIMKTHTTAGRAILDRVISEVPEIGYLEEAKNLATYHHEKWDGSGYPEGLKGEEIPLSARIMAVADVFDALVSPRCYKKPFSFEKSMSIIQEDAGTHFDPKISEVFVDASDEVLRIMDIFRRINEQGI